MKISSLQPWKVMQNEVSSKNTGSDFGNILKKTLDEVNDLQLEADKKTLNFSIGSPNTDIHDVMISMEKAQLALSMTIEVRNKLVESYQEIMRMQV